MPDEDQTPDWFGKGSWATDPRYPLEYKLRRWQLYTVMRQRRITWIELREELGGISNARLGQILSAMEKSDRQMYRLEDAINRITQRRHAALCSCEDWSGCAVYTAVYGTDERMIEVQKGALSQWRTEHAALLRENTRTVSLPLS